MHVLTYTKHFLLLALVVSIQSCGPAMMAAKDSGNSDSPGEDTQKSELTQSDVAFEALVAEMAEEDLEAIKNALNNAGGESTTRVNCPTNVSSQCSAIYDTNARDSIEAFLEETFDESASAQEAVDLIANDLSENLTKYYSHSGNAKYFKLRGAVNTAVFHQNIQEVTKDRGTKPCRVNADCILVKNVRLNFEMGDHKELECPQHHVFSKLVNGDFKKLFLDRASFLHGEIEHKASTINTTHSIPVTGHQLDCVEAAKQPTAVSCVQNACQAH